MYFMLSVKATMSAKSPWNTHAVVGIFYLRPFFAAKSTIVSPLSPLHNVEWIAEALSYLERHNFPLQCYLYHLHTTLFQDFWQALSEIFSQTARKERTKFSKHRVIDGADFNSNNKNLIFQHLAVIVPVLFHCLLFSAKFCDDYDVTFSQCMFVR